MPSLFHRPGADALDVQVANHGKRYVLVSPTQLVSLTIGGHMAMDGSGCFPSYATIAEESGLSKRTVIDHVQAAVVHGYSRNASCDAILATGQPAIGPFANRGEAALRMLAHALDNLSAGINATPTHSMICFR